jgi:hypothetical protein
MAGLVPAIYVLLAQAPVEKDVDARDKRGHDDGGAGLFCGGYDDGGAGLFRGGYEDRIFVSAAPHLLAPEDAVPGDPFE